MAAPLGKSRECSVSDAAAAMVACRSNARELLEEACILLQVDRQARAYTLLHTACEELAKYFMFEIAGRRVAQGNPPSWRRFWQRVRNHDSKIAQVASRLSFILGAEEQKIEANLALAGLEVLLEGGLKPRNASLYVEPSLDDSFRKPSDIDWSMGLTMLKATAERLLRAADEIGTSPEAIETALLEPPDARSKALALNVLRLAVIRMQDAGISEDEVRKLIDKSYLTSR